MYVPRQFEETDRDVLQALIRSRPLGAWVTVADRELVVNHIPFLLDATRGPHGTLVGHVARANPVWRNCSSEIASVVVFQGADAYITPSWYATKQEHGKVVPTWNYIVVHAHGVPRMIEDREWLLGHVTALSDHHEARQQVPWRVSDAPADYIETQLKAIVGIEIPISALVGKWKASQNRSLPDQRGTMTGLSERADEDSRTMAALLRERIARDEP